MSDEASPGGVPLQILNGVLLALCLIAAAYHLIASQWPVLDAIPHRITHVMMAISIAALGVIQAALSRKDKTAFSRFRGWAALFCVAGAVFSMGYFLIHATRLEMAQPYIDQLDVIVMGIAAVTVITITALVWGPVISTLVVLGVAYFFFGHGFSGTFGHPEYDVQFVMSYLGASLTLGMFGPITTVSADAIFLLILFGALFQTTGVLALFIEVGKWVGNRLRGGAAYSAVVGSALVGTVTGAAVANVALTGRITIPTMKRTGFKPEQAAAVEAVASAGGQIAPPIMGSAAFIMASLMEVPYLTIMTLAVVPAVLYFLGVGIGVYFMIRASRLDPPPEEVSTSIIVKHAAAFLVPMGVLIALLFQQYSPGYSAFWAIVTLMVVAQLVKATRSSFREWIQAFAEGALLASQIAVVLIAVGMMAQSAITTNLAMKLTFTVTGLVGQDMLPVLLIAMVVAILLGMELPTPVAYVLMFITVVPMMIDVGVDPFAANFFAFYFAILSTLTPPIALSVLTASRLAQGRFFPATGHAMRLSFVGYVLPFGFAINPALLGNPDSAVQFITTISVLIATMFVGNAALYGFCFRMLGRGERLLMAAAGLCGLSFVMSGSAIYAGGLVLFALAGMIGPLRQARQSPGPS